MQPSASPPRWLSDDRSAGDLLEVEATVQGGVSRWFVCDSRWSVAVGPSAGFVIGLWYLQLDLS